MTYILLSLMAIVLALLLAYIVYRLLFRASWFLAWLRGMSGLFFLGLIILCIVVAFDIYSYRQLIAEEAVADIRFKAINNQHYQATFTTTDGTGKDYALFGDQWRLDSRIIKWSSFATRLGVKTGYRLDRLSGRYLSLNDEHNKPRSIFALNESPAGIDTWLWLKNVDDFFDFVDARYGSSVFLPMVDDGHYQILLTNSGLIARPLNKISQEAIEHWQ